jgi:hypothetical protein
MGGCVGLRVLLRRESSGLKIRCFALIVLLIMVSSAACVAGPLELEQYLAMRKKLVTGIHCTP